MSGLMSTDSFHMASGTPVWSFTQVSVSVEFCIFSYVCVRFFQVLPPKVFQKDLWKNPSSLPQNQHDWDWGCEYGSASFTAFRLVMFQILKSFRILFVRFIYFSSHSCYKLLSSVLSLFVYYWLCNRQEIATEATWENAFKTRYLRLTNIYRW